MEDPAREWVARRFVGDPVIAIARDAGVSSHTVVRATNRFGPFPRLRTRGGEVVELEVLHARWVARRRAGESIASIARSDEATLPAVRKATAQWGPFPPPQRPKSWTVEQQQRWIKLRHDGYTIDEIAEGNRVSLHVVTAATRGGGPYRRPGRQSPDLISLSDLAIITGIRAPSTYGWWHRGLLPDPVATGTVGQPLWQRQVLDAWCQANLTTCPYCGAQALNLARHVSSRHHSVWRGASS